MNQSEREQFISSLERNGWRPPQVASYQIRNPDGTAGGWIAQVYVIRETSKDLTFQPLMEKNVKIYETKEAADEVAMRMGLDWLRQRVA